MFPLTLTCPACHKSLMDTDHTMEDHPSLALRVRVGEKEGMVYLSSLYGSREVEKDIEVEDGEITFFFCPSCGEGLPEEGTCPECRAPMVLLEIPGGPDVKICSRKGCPHHAIRFGQWDDVPISSIMRRGVVSVKMGKALSQIANILVNTSLEVLPVVDETQTLVGEIGVVQLMNHLVPLEVDTIDFRSYRKLLQCYRDWDTLTVGDIMTEDIPTLDPDISLEEAVGVFRRTRRSMLFIVRDGQIQGAVCIADLCKALIERRKDQT